MSSVHAPRRLGAAVLLGASVTLLAPAPALAGKGGGGLTTSPVYDVRASNETDACETPSTEPQSFQTIQAAITCAEMNGGAFTIEVAPGTYEENLRLGAEGPNTIALIGTAGALATVIDGHQNGRTIASYLPDASACAYGECTQLTPTIRGFTITGGTGKHLWDNVLGEEVVVGGGVYNGPGSNLTLANAIVSGNDVSAADDGQGGTLLGRGGGVFNDGFGALTLTSTKVTNNRATQGGGVAVAPLYYHCPVELCFAGSVSIRSSSVVSENRALSGGGLAAGTNGHVTISSSTFTANEATTSITSPDQSFPWFEGMGGAMASIAGLEYGLLPGGQITITSSNVTYNTADGGGGAIANIGGKLTVAGGAIANNTAAYGPGGAILNFLEASSSIVTPNINANSAGSVGGGIANCYRSSLNLSGGKIQGNTAALTAPSGGGVAADQTSPWSSLRTAIRSNTPDQTAVVTECFPGIG